MPIDCMAPDDPAPQPSAPPVVDPVRARRAAVAKWNTLATRVGYALYLLAVVMFFVALATSFSSGKVTVITTSMIIGSVLLAPAIVVGYAVKAAEKDDVARGL
ncbi:MAG: hypothetical protein JWM34_3821 [Ilumatobacteraceae bacterium]|nr:hypothetical protein [Ilumatobacteraceae bacterium]